LRVMRMLTAILMIGDIVGRPGRSAVQEKLPEIIAAEGIDFCVANAENAAGGSGITPEIAEALLAAGVDVLTTGDHVWRQREIIPYIQKSERLLRPQNLSPYAAGKGYAVAQARNGQPVGVLSLIGRIFMAPAESPFLATEQAVAELRSVTPLIIVDFHAEATSEKQAMGRWLDGKVSAVLGTHTHVATADEQILPGGTAYITDIGMTGPVDSIIGRRIDKVLESLRYQMPFHFDVAKGDAQIAGVIIEVDCDTGRAQHIRRFLEK